MKNPLFILALLLFTFISSVYAQKDETVTGSGILKMICGQWYGPVTSTTTAGSFDVWYTDFRPVSTSQVAQYSMLDSKTVNNFSFFVVKYNGKLKIAMRTEGCFAEKCCVTYEVIDSVDESSGYYRFADFVSGKQRAYTEFIFLKDTFTMNVYTTKFNKESRPVIHSTYKAVSAGRIQAEKAAIEKGFPKYEVVKDFTGVFINMKESIFFDLKSDPYKSDDQPKTGTLEVTNTIDPKLPTLSGQYCVLLTTEPLFSGLMYNPENLKYISKSVYGDGNSANITIKNIHPGQYYLYSFIDTDGDKKHKSGDYMSSKIQNIIEVRANNLVEKSVLIDLKIP